MTTKFKIEIHTQTSCSCYCSTEIINKKEIEHHKNIEEIKKLLTKKNNKYNR